MSRNSSGTYTLPTTINPVVAGETITADWANTTLNDVASALSTSISSTGVTTPTANLPMGGYKHTGVGDAAARNQYLPMGMGQDLRHIISSDVAGTNNLTGTLPGWVSGTPAAYPDHFMVAWEQPAANTGAVTWNVNGLGAKTLLSSSGTALVAGDLPTGSFNIAYYDGTNMVMLTDTTSTAENGTQQSATSGWIRPAGGVYPSFTTPTTTSVGVPAGTGRINLVTDGAVTDTTYVDWDAQTVTLTYVASDFQTVLMVNNVGAVVQYAGVAPPAAYRENIYLCTVEHNNSVINAVIRSPAIYADDGYLMRDLVSLIGNMLMSGGKVTENGGTPLELDITSGVVFYPGGDPDTELSPNLVTFSGATAMEFYTMSGADYVSAAVVTASPVTQYNPAAANAAAVAIPAATDAVIHRIYWRNGIFYWVFGQTLYASFSDALAHVLVDRSEFQLPSKLNGATLICEIIATKNATDYTDPTKTAIISNSGRYYLFGTSQIATDAPSDGTTYGRLNGAWAATIPATSPTIVTGATITGTAPRLTLDYSGAETAYSGYDVVSTTGFRQFSAETSIIDDKHYLRSRAPADGSIRYTTTFNLANGAWTLPGALTVSGAAALGEITSSGNGTFNGTGAITLSSGTTAQRPAGTNGMLRYNTTIGSFEGYADGAWGSVGGGAVSDLFYENDQTISTNVTLTANRNSMSAGPITIADGVTVTIPTGSYWVIV